MTDTNNTTPSNDSGQNSDQNPNANSETPKQAWSPLDNVDPAPEDLDVDAPEAEPTPEAAPIETATPEAAPVETATPEVAPTPEAAPVETAAPEVAPTPEVAPVETAAPEATPAPEAAPIEEAAPEVAPTPEAAPVENAAPEATPTPEAAPIETAAPEVAPTPEAAPAPEAPKAEEAAPASQAAPTETAAPEAEDPPKAKPNGFESLPAMIAKAIEEKGYEEPSAVQAACLKPEANGRDLLVSAQTGSGKTVAFGFALAEDLLDEDGRVPPAAGPLALVIAPTRELALQVSRELVWLFKYTGARVTTCVGGMDASKERRSLRNGAHIVVGTPGRLRDHLERGALNLLGLKTAVLDEADEMLDMGFRDELEEILDGTPDDRRTLLFSATIPRQIEKMANRYQNNALRISTVGDKRGHGDIAYKAVTVSPSEISNAVVNLLRFYEAPTAMLFCATRNNVRHLHATLQERGFDVVALSGEHSQQERNQALQALRDRRARVCVATDVAARGIDLPTLSLVIHVEVPRDAEALQHRSGRTGRAGKKGTAVILVPYQRRRRVEGMLRGARIEAEWTNAPTPEDIRKNDRERLLETLLQPAEFEDEDRELAQRLIAELTPEDIAAALVQAHRAKMPRPEELTANTPDARRDAQKERHRPGFEDTVWFRMDIGRRQNADPRWVLPLLCRRGHLTRNEIGAIRIGGAETFVQIPRNLASKFADAVARTAGPDGEGGEVTIAHSETGPREVARENRKQGGHGGGSRHGGGGGHGGPRHGGGGGNSGPRHGGGGRDGGRSNAGVGHSGERVYAKPHRKGPANRSHNGDNMGNANGEGFKRDGFKKDGPRGGSGGGGYNKGASGGGGYNKGGPKGGSGGGYKAGGSGNGYKGGAGSGSSSGGDYKKPSPKKHRNIDPFD